MSGCERGKQRGAKSIDTRSGVAYLRSRRDISKTSSAQGTSSPIHDVTRRLRNKRKDSIHVHNKQADCDDFYTQGPHDQEAMPNAIGLLKPPQRPRRRQTRTLTRTSQIFTRLTYRAHPQNSLSRELQSYYKHRLPNARHASTALSKDRQWTHRITFISTSTPSAADAHGTTVPITA